MKFRFVSSGQALSDAATVTQTLHGTSLFPLAPEVRGYRNTNLDLLIDLIRKARLGGGLRPSTDVPLAEEVPVFEIEFYNGSTLLRTVRLITGEARPVIWQRVGLVGVDILADGSISAAFSTQGGYTGNALQRIYGNFRLETTIDHTGTLTDGAVSILPLSGSWASGQPPGYIGATKPAIRFESSATMQVNVATGDRVMVELKGQTFYYYKNYNGPQTQPLFISTRNDISFPLFIQGFVQNDDPGTTFRDQILTATLQRVDFPDFLYTIALQTADFGSTQSAIKIRAFQISAIVGRGRYNETTI